MPLKLVPLVAVNNSCNGYLTRATAETLVPMTATMTQIEPMALTLKKCT